MRDDLEALGYMLVWLAGGPAALPWHNAKDAASVLLGKLAATPATLTKGKDNRCTGQQQAAAPFARLAIRCILGRVSLLAAPSHA